MRGGGGVEAPDPRTVVLHLKQPNVALLVYLAHPNASIVSAKIAQAAGGDLSKKDYAIGSGPFRLAEWAGALRSATRRTEVEDGLRIELASDVDLGDLGRLIGAEQHCCAFLRFSLTVDADGIVLEVRAPELAGGIVTDLFGSAA